MTLTASPAQIIRQYLIDQGIFTDPTDESTWPLYISFMPDAGTDNVAAIYDTQGIKQGRHMDGSHVWKYGVQILVRCSDYATGWQKAQTAAALLDDVAGGIAVSVSSKAYNLQNVSQASPLLPLGKDESNRRRDLFSLNFICTIDGENVVPIITLAHTTNATLLTSQMGGRLHTNEGAGSSTVRLTLPAAADGLNARFAQVDSGLFIIDPNAADHFEYSGGVMSAGAALELVNPVSGMFIISDGNNRWLVFDETGVITEE